MAKLKKARIHLAICPTCKGNGFVKIMKEELEPHVHQCWDCDSEGEIYVDESEVVEFYIDDDTPATDVGKLH